MPKSNGGRANGSRNGSKRALRFPDGAPSTMTALDDKAQRIHLAVRMRLLEGATWEQIAKRLGTTEATLRDNWRLTETWQRAKDAVVNAYVGDIGVTLLGRLMEIVETSENEAMVIAASRELLDRIGGSVPIKVQGDVEHKHTLVIEQFGPDDHGGGNRSQED